MGFAAQNLEYNSLVSMGFATQNLGIEFPSKYSDASPFLKKVIDNFCLQKFCKTAKFLSIRINTFGEAVMQNVCLQKLSITFCKKGDAKQHSCYRSQLTPSVKL